MITLKHSRCRAATHSITMKYLNIFSTIPQDIEHIFSWYKLLYVARCEGAALIGPSDVSRLITQTEQIDETPDESVFNSDCLNASCLSANRPDTLKLTWHSSCRLA